MSEAWLVACEALYALRRKAQSQMPDGPMQGEASVDVIGYFDRLIDNDGPGSGQDETVRDLFSELFGEDQGMYGGFGQL